jgi:hypothetical protein
MLLHLLLLIEGAGMLLQGHAIMVAGQGRFSGMEQRQRMSPPSWDDSACGKQSQSTSVVTWPLGRQQEGSVPKHQVNT